MSMELWKPIKGYKNLYEVSHLGRVRRLETYVWRTLAGTTFKQRVPAKLLRPGGAYPIVHLCKRGVPKAFYVHVLVAETFLGKRPKGKQVCHNDGNPKNPALKNLRYDTPIGNALDRTYHGTGAKGVLNPSAYLTPVKVKLIRRRLSNGDTCSEIAKTLLIPRTTVSNIKHGYTWSHLK